MRAGRGGAARAGLGDRPSSIGGRGCGWHALPAHVPHQPERQSRTTGCGPVVLSLSQGGASHAVSVGVTEATLTDEVARSRATVCAHSSNVECRGYTADGGRGQ